MKLVTVFGIASILSLLFVSTVLVLKQDSSKQLTEEFYENASCFDSQNEYNPNFYVPYHFYVWNICSLPKKFTITFDQGTIITGCLQQNVKIVTTVHEETVQVYKVNQSDC
ncbi:hypothetical protein ABPG72_003939 [Tetrahymena utriculariae]